MAKLNLIKNGKFEELEAQVFNQTLGGEGTYTAVLDEAEELALVEAIYDGSVAAKKFAMQYWQHYAPFNSSVKLMIERPKYPAMPDILQFIIKKWGVVPEQIRMICQQANTYDSEIFLPLAEICAKNIRSTQVNPEMVYWFEKLDNQYETKLLEIYQNNFQNK